MPILQIDLLYILLAIRADLDLEIKTIDIIIAYPRSKLYVEVYARPIELLKSYLEISRSDRVLRLKNILYRLKQLGREWYIKVYRGLKSLDFKSLFSKPSIFKN